MYKKIETLLIELLELEELPVELSENTCFFNDLSFDSLTLMRLIFKCEEVFDIDLDPDEISLEVFRNMGTFVDYLQKEISSYELCS